MRIKVKCQNIEKFNTNKVPKRINQNSFLANRRKQDLNQLY
jgi:hypothetical protein